EQPTASAGRPPAAAPTAGLLASCEAISAANARVSASVALAASPSGTGMPRIKYDTATALGASILNLGCFWTAAFTAAWTASVNFANDKDVASAMMPPCSARRSVTGLVTSPDALESYAPQNMNTTSRMASVHTRFCKGSPGGAS